MQRHAREGIHSHKQEPKASLPHGVVWQRPHHHTGLDPGSSGAQTVLPAYEPPRHAKLRSISTHARARAGGKLNTYMHTHSSYS